MTCTDCKNKGGQNNGKCNCPCHKIFSDQVADLLNMNTMSENEAP